MIHNKKVACKGWEDHVIIFPFCGTGAVKHMSIRLHADQIICVYRRLSNSSGSSFDQFLLWFRLIDETGSGLGAIYMMFSSNPHKWSKKKHMRIHTGPAGFGHQRKPTHLQQEDLNLIHFIFNKTSEKKRKPLGQNKRVTWYTLFPHSNHLHSFCFSAHVSICSLLLLSTHPTTFKGSTFRTGPTTKKSVTLSLQKIKAQEHDQNCQEWCNPSTGLSSTAFVFFFCKLSSIKTFACPDMSQALHFRSHGGICNDPPCTRITCTCAYLSFLKSLTNKRDWENFPSAPVRSWHSPGLV